MYICTRNTEIVKHFIGAISSAGSEHLVYTEGVGGSNPSSPTKINPTEMWDFFIRQDLIYMPYTVYILHSLTKDKFYIGYTANLTERIIRHNQKSKGFTGSTNDWILVFQEEFNSQSEAIQREKQIKSWKSKIKIQELIQQNNN